MARKVITMLHRGVRFTPTQPDVNRIEQIISAELAVEKNQKEKINL